MLPKDSLKVDVTAVKLAEMCGVDAMTYADRCKRVARMSVRTFTSTGTDTRFANRSIGRWSWIPQVFRTKCRNRAKTVLTPEKTLPAVNACAGCRAYKLVHSCIWVETTGSVDGCSQKTEAAACNSSSDNTCARCNCASTRLLQKVLQ